MTSIAEAPVVPEVDTWRDDVLEALETQELSMAYVARRAEMHPSHLSRLLGGHHDPQLGTAVRLCQVLKIKLPRI